MRLLRFYLPFILLGCGSQTNQDRPDQATADQTLSPASALQDAAMPTSNATTAPGKGVPRPGNEPTDKPVPGTEGEGTPPTKVSVRAEDSPAQPEPVASQLSFRSLEPIKTVIPLSPVAKMRTAPEQYESVVPRLQPGKPVGVRNLILEANNLAMRGPREKNAGPYRAKGIDIARRWRRNLAGLRGVFVLRDSLFSQQDHPFRQDPYAPMLPPNWIAVMAHLSATKQPVHLPVLPAVEADEKWHRLARKDIFGPFPGSDSLFARVTAKTGAAADPWTKVYAHNGRRTLKILMDDAKKMTQFHPRGAQAVADAGAELIARSDRDYYGAELRRKVVIPIFVENPNPKEFGEGKGLEVKSLGISQGTLKIVMTRLYRRRLQDGDIAIERYDLSNQGDRKRAVTVLEAIIPRDGTEGKSTVWLWVNGRLDPKRKLRGEGPLAYVPDFRKQLAEANIDLTRLKLLAKPTVFIKGSRAQRRSILGKHLDVYNRNQVMMSVSSTVSSFTQLITE